MEAPCQHREKIDPETEKTALMAILELLDPAMPEATQSLDFSVTQANKFPIFACQKELCEFQ